MALAVRRYNGSQSLSRAVERQSQATMRKTRADAYGLMSTEHATEAAREASVPLSSELEAVRDFWDQHVHDWKIARHAPGSPEFFVETEEYRFEKLEYLARLVDFDGYPGKAVLDVGCGIGNDLSRFARGGADVTGIDLSPQAIRLARLNFEQRGLDGRFEVMNGEAMTYPEDSFDVVYCHTVLQFTPDPRRMISEVHRVLRPGGQAILMMINRRSWLNVMHRIAKVEIDHLESPIFRRFRISEFADMLGQFSHVRIVPERFPVRTKVHSGLKAAVYNLAFVDLFNVLPRSFVRGVGHHLLAYCTKA
jgi:2-polyprenyl-3-methyl-5-hydroxy-6-metoxy-1,4-benzoquinol methylase